MTFCGENIQKEIELYNQHYQYILECNLKSLSSRVPDLQPLLKWKLKDNDYRSLEEKLDI